jgi:hypothetical protein
LSESLRFGRAEVRPRERQLLVEGVPAGVGARAFDVLLALIDRRDRLVTKTELLDLVWPGLVHSHNRLCCPRHRDTLDRSHRLRPSRLTTAALRSRRLLTQNCLFDRRLGRNASAQPACVQNRNAGADRWTRSRKC